MTPLHHVRPLIPSGDPKTDPFLLLMEDWFPRGVFDRHPHRGMETVTYVIDGRLDHYDNYGNQGSVFPGNAQWMTAGRGIIHNEQPPGGVTVHSLQLWVNLPAADKMVEPRTQNLVAADLPLRREQGAEIRVFSGTSGDVIAPTKNYSPVTMLEARLEAGGAHSPGTFTCRLQRVPGRAGRRWADRWRPIAVTHRRRGLLDPNRRRRLFRSEHLWRNCALASSALCRPPSSRAGGGAGSLRHEFRRADSPGRISMYREGRFEPSGRLASAVHSKSQHGLYC